MNIEAINSISSLKIDINKIIQLQDQFWPVLSEIDKSKPDYSMSEKANKLYLAIHKRMQKYIPRLADEYKLRKEKDIIKMYNDVMKEISDYANILLGKVEKITQEDINTLHTKLYPKWLWGTTIWPHWERFFKKYPAGEYRKERDFRINRDWQEYEYADFRNIPELVEMINDFLYIKDNKIHFLFNASLFFLYITWVHPFYNGNGTVYIIILSIILLKNWYDVPEDLQEYNKICSDLDIFINARHNLDYEPYISWFLKLFIKQNEV